MRNYLKTYNIDNIITDRNKLGNKHELILGAPGSGKSFLVMTEINKILEQTDNSHILIIDIDGGWSKAFAKNPDAEIISITSDTLNINVSDKRIIIYDLHKRHEPLFTVLKDISHRVYNKEEVSNTTYIFFEDFELCEHDKNAKEMLLDLLHKARMYNTAITITSSSNFEKSEIVYLVARLCSRIIILNCNRIESALLTEAHLLNDEDKNYICDQLAGCGLLLQGNDKYYFCNNPIESYIGMMLLGENLAVTHDSRYYNYKDYLNQTHLQLEKRHNYIQYMFPTDIPSKRIGAPTINADGAYILGKNKTVRENLRLATEVMIEFFTSKKNWRKNDHNFKRISRILRCLRLFGLDDEADRFYETILSVTKSVADDKTKTYWFKNNRKVERNFL
ncbi:MAG: DUF87 domain-containing protein [Lachnospiraceae bacterium]|nr:DUF87 domain-containing protein [Lachnospiraceae bacterium]